MIKARAALAHTLTLRMDATKRLVASAALLPTGRLAMDSLSTSLSDFHMSLRNSSESRSECSVSLCGHQISCSAVRTLAPCTRLA